MHPISICAIMKNEEKNLDFFLTTIKKHFSDYPYEIVIADTGSIDQSLHIAKKHNVTLCYFEWMNDFSAARNYALSQCKNDWVLVLDIDEFIEKIDVSKLHDMMEQYPNGVGMLSRKNRYIIDQSESIYTDEVERFFNRSLYHYEGIIHENVRTLSGDGSYQRIQLPITVDHHGYNGSLEDMQKKVSRNNELLLKALSQTPDDPYVYFQLGQSFSVLHDAEQMCYYYGKGLAYDVDPALEYVQMMVIGYGYALIDLNRYEEALAFEAIYEEFATTADFICLMGIIYLRNYMLEPAIEEFQKAIKHPISHTAGTNSFIPSYNLGCIYEVLGNTNLALEYYKKCGNYEPAIIRMTALKE